MENTQTQIKAIQSELKKIGYYKLVVDGDYGPYTVNAVKAFQKTKGLLQDGIIGPVTAKALGLTDILYPPISNTTDFGVGYFINRIWTPLENIDWNTLKAKGITEVYIRCAEENLTAISKYLPQINAAGLKPYAWTWQGFTMTKEAVAAGWNICADIEDNNNLSHVTEIKAIQAACKAGGKTFILCTKAEGTWDGDQAWSTVVPLCDYIMPMLYLGDYKKSISQLESYMKTYNRKYPGKIYPALETYISDANPRPKPKADITAEIETVKPYCEGVALFRYGICNYLK